MWRAVINHARGGRLAVMDLTERGREVIQQLYF
jgi:hypothetical protein